MEKIKKAAELWKNAKKVIILSGAGMSTASGLPDFRSKTGLWKQRPESLATINALKNTPKDFYFFYQWRIDKLWHIEPNDGHVMIANAEKKGLIDLIVTQNVDGLHQRAGAQNVVEVHGTLNTISCIQCNSVYDSKTMLQDVNWDEQNPEDFVPGKECYCTKCGGQLRPDVVLFGEQLPRKNWQKAVHVANDADLVIVLGSSLLVGPANSLPEYTLDNNGKLIIINNDSTYLDDRADIVINNDIPTTLLEIEKFL